MPPNERKILRCAVYTRKSSEHGLEQDFNSLDAQREAGEAYIKSQAHEGWKLIKTHYDDGGLSGGTLERPALQSLLTDIRARKIDVVVVYKVDRLTRSLAVRHLINEHGRPFDGQELDALERDLDSLNRANREAFRDANARAVATYPAGRMLIVSGPGTGKSRLFRDRILFWLKQDGAVRI